MFAVLLRMSPWAFDWRVLPVIVAFEEFKMLTAVIALERWGCIWISTICPGKRVVRNVYDFAAGDPHLSPWKRDQVVSVCGDMIVFDRDVMARGKDYATVRIARYRII